MSEVNNSWFPLLVKYEDESTPTVVVEVEELRNGVGFRVLETNCGAVSF